MKSNKIYIVFAFLFASLATTACFDDQGFDILWDGLEIEFQDASLPSNGPLISNLRLNDDQVDSYNIRVNVVGAQQTAPITVNFVVDETSTAIEGVHYRLAANSVTIPAGESFAVVPLEVLTGNISPAEAPNLVLRITDTGGIKLSPRYNTVTHRLRSSCPSDLVGTYNTVNVGTGGTINSQVEITRVAGTTDRYLLSDITGGVYRLYYGDDDNPGEIVDFCNTLSLTDQPDVVYGDDLFNGTGTVNPDGTMTLSWSNGYGDYGVTTFTRAPEED